MASAYDTYTTPSKNNGVLRATLTQSAAVNEVNQGLSHLAETEKGVSYIDVNPALETNDGAALAACYVEDQLHFTPEGYRRMAAVLKPAMERDFAATAKNEVR